MAKPPVNLAGRTKRERRLWTTYMWWARDAFPDPLPDSLWMKDPSRRLDPEREKALLAILYSCFILEYRLRSVYDLLGLATREKDALWALLSNLENRLRGAKSFRGRAMRLPSSWPKLRTRLQHLLELRNIIAHARYPKLNPLLGKRPSTLWAEARRGYNATIDAMNAIHFAIGYEHLRGPARQKYYADLKVARK